MSASKKRRDSPVLGAPAARSAPRRHTRSVPIPVTLSGPAPGPAAPASSAQGLKLNTMTTRSKTDPAGMVAKRKVFIAGGTVSRTTGAKTPVKVKDVKQATPPEPLGAGRGTNVEKAKDGSLIYRRRQSNSSSSSGSAETVGMRKRMGLMPKAETFVAPSTLAPGKRIRTKWTNSAGEEVESDGFCWLCHKEADWVNADKVKVKEADGVNTDKAKVKEESSSDKLTCQLCPRVYHNKCQGVEEATEEWVCPECEKIMVAECVETRSEAMSLITIDQLFIVLRYAVQRMKFPESEPFFKPVDTTEAPNYRDFIVNPLDLTTLEKNIRKKSYGCTEAFLADVKWVLHNCVIYNGWQHKLTKVAKMMVKICKHEMNEIEICPDCYMNSCTKRNLNWFCEPCRVPHTLVWAKMKGYPFWPAKALRHVNGQVDVRFFGEHDRSWVAVNQVFLLSKEPPVAIRKGTRGFEESTEEVELHIKRIREEFGSFEYAPTGTVYVPPVSEGDEPRSKTTKSKARSPPKPPTTPPGPVKSPTKVSMATRTATAVKLKYNSIISTRRGKAEEAGEECAQGDGEEAGGSALGQDSRSTSPRMPSLEAEDMAPTPQKGPTGCSPARLSPIDATASKTSASKSPSLCMTPAGAGVFEITDPTLKEESTKLRISESPLIIKSEDINTRLPDRDVIQKIQARVKELTEEEDEELTDCKPEPMETSLGEDKNDAGSLERPGVGGEASSSMHPGFSRSIDPASTEKPSISGESPNVRTSVVSPPHSELVAECEHMETDQDGCQEEQTDVEMSLPVKPNPKLENLVASCKAKLGLDGEELPEVGGEEETSSSSGETSDESDDSSSGKEEESGTGNSQSQASAEETDGAEGTSGSSDKQAAGSIRHSNQSPKHRPESKSGISQSEDQVKTKAEPTRTGSQSEPAAILASLTGKDEPTSTIGLSEDLEKEAMVETSSDTSKEEKYTCIKDLLTAKQPSEPVTATAERDKPCIEVVKKTETMTGVGVSGRHVAEDDLSGSGIVKHVIGAEGDCEGLTGNEKNSDEGLSVKGEVTKGVGGSSQEAGEGPRGSEEQKTVVEDVKSDSEGRKRKTMEDSVLIEKKRKTSSDSREPSPGGSQGSTEVKESSHEKPQTALTEPSHEKPQTALTEPSHEKPQPAISEPSHETSTLRKPSTPADTPVLDSKETTSPALTSASNPAPGGASSPRTPVSSSPAVCVARPSTSISSEEYNVDMTGFDFGKYTGMVMGTVQQSMKTMCEDLLKAEQGSAINKHIQLEMERMRWRHQQEMDELKHNADLTLAEMRLTLERERQTKLELQKADLEKEKQDAVESAKKKQWCAYCGKEAIFYCCWNTSYCDYPCQQNHWPQHMSTCTQASPESGEGDGVTAERQVQMRSWKQAARESLNAALERQKEERSHERQRLAMSYPSPQSVPQLQVQYVQPATRGPVPQYTNIQPQPQYAYGNRPMLRGNGMGDGYSRPQQQGTPLMFSVQQPPHPMNLIRNPVNYQPRPF